MPQIVFCLRLKKSTKTIFFIHLKRWKNVLTAVSKQLLQGIQLMHVFKFFQKRLVQAILSLKMYLVCTNLWRSFISVN